MGPTPACCLTATQAQWFCDTGDVLHRLDDCDDRVATRDAVIAGLDDHLRSAIANKGLGDAGQVERAEAEVAADPARAIRFDASGAATVTAAGRSYQGGRFEVLRLCEPRARALQARVGAGRPAAPRCWREAATSCASIAPAPHLPTIDGNMGWNDVGCDQPWLRSGHVECDEFAAGPDGNQHSEAAVTPRFRGRRRRSSCTFVASTRWRAETKNNRTEPL